MSGLQTRGEDVINGVDVREQGSALRVATNTPHLVSLGTGRFSTAVTLHPIKQGRVTIGSDPTCDIYVVGTGVASVHCRVENSHGVVTLYPISGSTLLDATPVDRPTRLSQGSMLTIGRSNYLRFNHPEEAKLMKSVLTAAHVSMAPVQFQPNELCLPADYTSHQSESNNNRNQTPAIQEAYRDHHLNNTDHDADPKDTSRKKPPPAPRKPYKDSELSDSNSDQESKPKRSSIMAKVSKFEYYAKQQKNIGRSQFYTSNENDISPKVFSANSLTVNTPAKDVLGGRTVPNYINKTKQDQKIIVLNENNAVDPKNCSYANVAIRNKTKIGDLVRNFDDTARQDYSLPKKINNSQARAENNIYGKINVDRKLENDKNILESGKNNLESGKNNLESGKNNLESGKDNLESGKNNLESGKNNLDSGKNNLESGKNNLESGKNNLDSGKNSLDSYMNNMESLRIETGELVRIGDKSDRNAKAVRAIGLPSPSFDRNPQYSPVYANNHYERSLEAESMRMKAYQDRIKEEEQKEAETARLEEILNMCAEYERQIAAGIPITPTEKRSQNKIITNGSLPRSAANSPNLVQTKDGYYKFDTGHMRTNAMSQSLPVQRNVSSYENYDVTQSPHVDTLTPEVTIHNQTNCDDVDKIHELGIPVFDETTTNVNQQLSSPIMIRKLTNQYDNKTLNITSPIGSPYENVYHSKSNVYSNLKPKSPNTQSPRSRIKTTFAHKNVQPPQYFIFPTPPPVDNSKVPNFNQSSHKNRVDDVKCHVDKESATETTNFGGIEKQLSLEEEIPMIDDSDLTNDLEFRYTKVQTNDDAQGTPKAGVVAEIEPTLVKNQSFEDVKKELMADIPELEEFENDLKQNKRDKIIKHITEDVRKICIDSDIDTSILDDDLSELKVRYASLKDSRRKLVAEIYDIKCKMTEIRSQEDDILRELEMEKALIKGEYDSEIAILNIEQRKKVELVERAKRIEEEMRQLKETQEIRQSEMRDRVEIATLKVERIKRNINDSTATVEELQNAQDILDNETKIFEDLEFQHLEEESELLANREDIQNEIITLTKKIDSQKNRILTLKSEANNNLTSALHETKVLQAEYVRLLNQVEELTGKVQAIEKELRAIVAKLKETERVQSLDSADYADQLRARSGEFGYSPQSSDSDDMELTKISNFEDHKKQIKDKFNSIDQMSQSMIVDIERRVLTDGADNDTDNRYSESPSKSSTSSKEKKGFWERNFDSLKRKNKKQKSPEKVDAMSQSLNENMFYNNDTIETDAPFDRFNSLRHSKGKKEKKDNGPVKSSSSSKIPTFSALGKIMKKDSFGRKARDVTVKKDKDKAEEANDSEQNVNKNRYVKNPKPVTENKYSKAKATSPDKNSFKDNGTIHEEQHEEANESPNQKGHNVTFELFRKTIDNPNTDNTKIMHRKSCGDEPGMRNANTDLKKISDSGKIPSQDDIDRISKVTIDAPILSSDADMKVLGKRTIDSLMEIERKRMEMLEEQGSQVIENEREKISELKKRVQDETKKLWDLRCRSEQSRSLENELYQRADGERGGHTKSLEIDRDRSFNEHGLNRSPEDDYISIGDEFSPPPTSADDSRLAFDRSALDDDSYNASCGVYEDSSGLMSSSIEELQVRNSHTESTEDDKRSDDSRPLSNASDFSRDLLQLGGAPRRSRRGVAPSGDPQRPLTRYLPVDRDDFDLRRHVESAGHQVELCPYVSVSPSSCRGYLHKLGAKFHTWSKRWFVFDRETKTFVYYWDKSEKKPRGGAYFQVIEEVYLDHGNTSRSPSPQTTFIVKTRQRRYYLMAPSGEAARVWIDVIFTGAQGYTGYQD